MKGRVKEKLGKVTNNDLGEIEGRVRNFWGFYESNMDISGTKPIWNIMIVPNWRELSVVYAKQGQKRQKLWQFHKLLATGSLY